MYLLLAWMPISSQAQEQADSANLHEALAPPKATHGGTEVRSFTRKDKAVITEYSRGGHVYLMKVQPAGGLPAYYLEDTKGDGNMSRRLPGGYQHLEPPEWVIKRF